jgi:hypothetical protein
MGTIEDLYAAAAAAGLLVEAEIAGHTVWVEFRAPEEPVLDGFALSSEYALRLPASAVPGLGIGDPVAIAGIAYRVRDLRALGDGAERRVLLSREDAP